MPSIEDLLDTLHPGATPEELRPIGHYLGECVARRQTDVLSRFSDRARQLRRRTETGSWLRGFVDALTAYLDGYFAELEPAVQRERLAREVAEQPLWCEILHVLRDRPANQVAIQGRIVARAAGVASSKSAISIALDDLRLRELVEYVPGTEDRREHIHSLTRRGEELLREPTLAPGAAAPLPRSSKPHDAQSSAVAGAPDARAKPVGPARKRHSTAS